VVFGFTPAASVIYVNATTLDVVTPAHTAGSFAVVITDPDGQIGTLPAGITFNLPAPSVTGVVPGSGSMAGAPR